MPIFANTWDLIFSCVVRLLRLFHRSGFFLVREGLLDLCHYFLGSSGTMGECIIPAFSHCGRIASSSLLV